MRSVAIRYCCTISSLSGTETEAGAALQLWQTTGLPEPPLWAACVSRLVAFGDGGAQIPAGTELALEAVGDHRAFALLGVEE